jgi:hypothetical protein
VKLNRQGVRDLGTVRTKPAADEQACPGGFGAHDWRYLIAHDETVKAGMWCRRCGARG